MSGGRAAALSFALGAVALAAPALGTTARVSPAAPEREAIIAVVDGVSFEQLMGNPTFRQLAAAGGSALMSVKTIDIGGATQREAAAFATIADGTRDVPVIDGRVTRRSELAATLDASSIPPCFFRVPPPEPGTPLVPKADQAPLLLGGASGQACEAGSALSIPQGRRLVVLDGGLPETADALRRQVPALDVASVLVVVATPSPSARMDAVGDEVTPVIVAEGRPSQLFPSNSPPRALVSDTTRQVGLVSNVDVAPTILRFFGIDVPGSMDGQPIRFTNAAAPFALHQRHLEQRRIRLPIQLAEVAFISAAGAAAIAALVVLALGRTLPTSLNATLRLVVVAGAALPLVLLAGGALPRFTYAWVVPFVVVLTAALAALAVRSRWPGVTRPFVFLALVSLGFIAIDAAVFGGHAFRIPLLGGTMFDGVRFYGLPNSFIALVLASALFVASRLEPFRGFLLLVAVGLFCGFPSLGANVGASITLFVAAGLWWVLRTRRRFGVKEVAFTLGTAALGLAAVLMANRRSPGAPTHATAFVERSRGGIGALTGPFVDRLSIGWHQLNSVPAAYIPMIGLLVVLGLAVRPRGPVARAFEVTGEAWRHVVIVLCVAALASFFVNDTGVAAAAPAFLYAMAAITYPALLHARADAEVVA